MKSGEILLKMASGWELGVYSGFRCRQWLQKNGLCRGGESVTVRMASVLSLVRARKIVEVPKKVSDPFWLTRYALASAGKEPAARSQSTRAATLSKSR